MENYFNYFTEIEEYFWKKRGTALLVSTLDWALIDSWKQTDIPIEVVLKGIDRSFEKYEARRRKTRRINSLAYCHQEVLAAAADQERTRLQHPSEPAPFLREELVKFLESNAAAVEKAAGHFAAHQRPESAATFRSIAASLHQLAAGTANDPPSALEDVERHLTALEDKMHSTLLQAADEQDLVAWRAELDRQLAPVRRQMTLDQIAQLEKQFLLRKLLTQAELPRLSLFYL
ncbi:MAG: hypothetical protein HY651_05435 [Acidobacteria bacterium]|nr:hypothetical protein [Acidobacteriota bacterium]